MSSKVKTFLALFVFLSVAAFASAEGGHHGFDWIAFLGRTFNAAVLFGGLVYLMRKPLIKLLSDKSLGIKEDILSRQQSISVSKDEYQAVKDRLEKIEAELASMRETARNRGNEEKQRIQDLGRSEVERLKKVGQEEIENRMEAAVNRLKQQIADLSIEQFKKDIEESLNDDLHHRVIENNIDICGDIIERK